MRGSTGTTRAQPSEILRIALLSCEKQIDRRREISAAVFELVRALHWRVTGFHWGELYKSYHWADLQLDNHHFSILFEQNSRVTALAQRERPTANWVFIDDPTFAEVVVNRALPFVPASVANLTRDLTAADQALIADHPDVVSEYNMRYWKPRTVGDVLYNFWD